MHAAPPQDPQQDLERPARKQVSQPVGPARSNRPRQDPSTVNIWSGKRIGGASPQEARQRSEHRCVPRLDSGRTRGSDAWGSTFCIYFAKGLCTAGAACQHLHRLPTAADEARLAPQTDRDAFGRERLPTPAYDRRGGAGSMDRDSHTIYVHYGGAGVLPLPRLRPLLEADFGEWGPLQNIHIVADKTIAFVRYHWRCTAEFAKEAMHGQGLRGSKTSEILRCRWASDDPNPGVVAAHRRGAEQALLDAQAAAFERLPPEVKRARVAAAALGGGAKVTAVAGEYPDTDAAYGEAEGSVAWSEVGTSHYAGLHGGEARDGHVAGDWGADHAVAGTYYSAAGVYPDKCASYTYQQEQQAQWSQQQQTWAATEPQVGWQQQQQQDEQGQDEGAPAAADGDEGTALQLLAAYTSSDEGTDSDGGEAKPPEHRQASAPADANVKQQAGVAPAERLSQHVHDAEDGGGPSM